MTVIRYALGYPLFLLGGAIAAVGAGIACVGGMLIIGATEDAVQNAARDLRRSSLTLPPTPAS